MKDDAHSMEGFSNQQRAKMDNCILRNKDKKEMAELIDLGSNPGLVYIGINPQ